MNRLEFYGFTLWNYPFVPNEDDADLIWISLSNKHYEPQFGHQRLMDYIDTFAEYERAGFDGIVVNEHHGTAGATTPSPNLTAAMLVMRTKNIPIAVIGNMLPGHLTPVRVAEEIAYLDVVSGGRIISGFVRGTGMEYYLHPIDPSSARDRFWEGHDLIIKAWTTPGPFAWNGEYYHVPAVNPWPRPLQQPHPEIWIPGVGSLDTVEKVARLGYRYMTVFAPKFFVKAQYDLFRRVAAEAELEVRPNQLLATVPTHVAETDAQAHREAKAHMMWLFHRHLRVPPHIFFPPGFMEKRSFRGMLDAKKKYGIKDFSALTYEDLLEQGYIIVGSPQTVAEKLDDYCTNVGAGGIIGISSPFGAMPKWMTLKSMQIASEEVIPKFRGPDGKPVWAREDRAAPHTVAELAARHGKPAISAQIRLEEGGPLVDVARAYIPGGKGDLAAE